MKIIADTNVLVRAVVQDDERQARVAIDALRSADTIAVSATSLCEFVWVLRRYKFDRAAVAKALTALTQIENVVIDHASVESGRASQQAGGDFADGVIAKEGITLGGETFCSFDKKATSVLAAQGYRVQLLVG